jgi:hypothetical protein
MCTSKWGVWVESTIKGSILIKDESSPFKTNCVLIKLQFAEKESVS